MTERSEGTPAREEGDHDPSQLTDEGLAAYLLDALIVFRQMKEKRDLSFLTYLLDMAAQEASSLCESKPARSRKT